MMTYIDVQNLLFWFMPETKAWFGVGKQAAESSSLPCVSFYGTMEAGGTLMVTPLIDMEGTWEEVAERLPAFAGRKLRFIVLPVEEAVLEREDTRPIADVLAEIAAKIPQEEVDKLPPDFTDQLDHYIYGAPKR
jgi:hypothetical protein